MATILRSGSLSIWDGEGYGYEPGLDYSVELSGNTISIKFETHPMIEIVSPTFTVTYNGTTKNTGYMDYTTWDSATLSFTYSKSCSSLVITGTWNAGSNTIHFDSTYGPTSKKISWTATNAAPTVSFTMPSSVIAGQPVSLKWTTSDADGETVSTTNLTRYLKKSGESSYTATTLINKSTSNKSYTDTIPSDAGGGTVYYKVTVTDGYESASATSNTASITSNRTPVISGTNGNIGTFDLTSPTYSYTVTDADGDKVSVTETMDGSIIRSFTATLGQTNTIAYTDLAWLKTLNGSHTIQITATDVYGASAVRTVTFTKNVTSLSFTLEIPLDADDQITRAVESMVAAIPSGAVITIEVCNNGYDANPIWENVTQRVLNGEKFFFSNTQKTADKWGYNVRVNVHRGTATGDCYVATMTGFFE